MISQPAATGKTVLLAWELGGRLGHVRRLLVLADALAAHGHRPVLALKDLVGPWPVLRNVSYPVFQAPNRHPRPRPIDQPFLAASFGDILAVIGFAEIDELLPLVRGWDALLEFVRPALVVCDHCPTLCLAAYHVNPTVLIGSGFTLPPVDGPTFPPLFRNRPPLVPESDMLAEVTRVQHCRNQPAPPTLPAIFARTDRCLTVLPELDPYQSLRHEEYLGPLEPLPPPSHPPPEPRFFAYLDALVVSTEPALTVLAQAGYAGEAFVFGADAAMRARLRGAGLIIHDTPLPLPAMLAAAAVVVHHGGTALAHAALAAGRPQLLFPEHLEHALTLQLLERLGVARGLSGQFLASAVPETMRELVTNPRIASRATMAAHDVESRHLGGSLPRVLERCLQLLD
jgi:rhamnosyltransferase subunit B